MIDTEERESMYPRVEFEISSKDLVMILNNNEAWRSLGLKMGFDPWTVQVSRGKGQRFFTAISTESLEARAERELKEKEEKFIARRQELENEIAEKNDELNNLIKKL